MHTQNTPSSSTSNSSSARSSHSPLNHSSSTTSPTSAASPESGHDLMQLLAFCGIRFGNLLSLAGLGQEHQERLLNSRRKASDSVFSSKLNERSRYSQHASALPTPPSHESGLEALRTRTGFFNSADVSTDDILNAVNANFSPASQDPKLRDIAGTTKPQQKPLPNSNLPEGNTDSNADLSRSSNASPALQDNNRQHAAKPTPNAANSSAKSSVSPLVDPSSGFLNDFPADMIPPYIQQQPSRHLKDAAGNAVSHPMSEAMAAAIHNNPHLFQSRSDSPTLTMDQLRQIDLASKSLDKNSQMDLSQNSLSREDLAKFWSTVANRNGRTLPAVLSKLDVSYTMPTRIPHPSDSMSESSASSGRMNSSSTLTSGDTSVSPQQFSNESELQSMNVNEVFKSFYRARERTDFSNDYNVFRNISLQSVAPSTHSEADVEQSLRSSPPLDEPMKDTPSSKAPGTPSFEQILEEMNTYNFSTILGGGASANHSSTSGPNADVLAAVSAVNTIGDSDSASVPQRSRTPSLLDIYYQYQQQQQQQQQPRQDSADERNQSDTSSLQRSSRMRNSDELRSIEAPLPEHFHSFPQSSGLPKNFKAGVHVTVPRNLPPLSVYDFIPRQNSVGSFESIQNKPSEPPVSTPPPGFDSVPMSSSPPKSLGGEFALPVYMEPSQTIPGTHTFISRAELQAAAREYLNNAPLPSVQPEPAVYSELSERIFRCSLHWVLHYYAKGDFAMLERTFSSSFSKSEHFQITRILSALQIGLSVSKSKWVGKIEDDGLFPGYYGPVAMQEQFMVRKMQLGQHGLDIDEDAFVQSVGRSTFCLGSIPRVTSTLLDRALDDAAKAAQLKNAMSSAAAQGAGASAPVSSAGSNDRNT